MPRYIEEDAIRQGKFHLNYLIPDGDKDDSYWYQLGWNEAIDTVLDCLPKVEAEPVVRCKDCKYFDHSDFGKGEEYWCKHFVSTDDYTHSHKVIEDDFCAWGERRIDETD